MNTRENPFILPEERFHQMYKSGAIEAGTLRKALRGETVFILQAYFKMPERPMGTYMGMAIVMNPRLKNLQEWYLSNIRPSLEEVIREGYMGKFEEITTDLPTPFKKQHNVLKTDSCYHCTKCKRASGDASGIYSHECIPLVELDKLCHCGEATTSNKTPCYEDHAIRDYFVDEEDQKNRRLITTVIVIATLVFGIGLIVALQLARLL